MSPADDPSSRWRGVDEAVLKLATDAEDLSRSDVDGVLRWLMSTLRRRFADFAEADLEDVIQEAILKFRRSARSGTVNLARNPSGYLLRTATNTAIDKWRATSQRSTLVDPTDFAGLADSGATPDDDVAARMDARADAARVRKALSAAHKAGDETTVRVVSYLLEEVELHGQLPSNRAAGEALGLSHTGVANALKRFRDLISHTGDPPTSGSTSGVG